MAGGQYRVRFFFVRHIFQKTKNKKRSPENNREKRTRTSNPRKEEKLSPSLSLSLSPSLSSLIPIIVRSDPYQTHTTLPPLRLPFLSSANVGIPPPKSSVLLALSPDLPSPLPSGIKGREREKTNHETIKPNERPTLFLSPISRLLSGRGEGEEVLSSLLVYLFLSLSLSP